MDTEAKNGYLVLLVIILWGIIGYLCYSQRQQPHYQIQTANTVLFEVKGEVRSTGRPECSFYRVVEVKR